MSDRHLFNAVSGGFIEHDHYKDGLYRRGFLKCMAWAGTGALCVIEGGVLKSYALDSHNKTTTHRAGGLTFAQISDSHMGFNKPANPDVVGTLKAAVDKIKALPHQPEFILHTGDISWATSHFTKRSASGKSRLRPRRPRLDSACAKCNLPDFRLAPSRFSHIGFQYLSSASHAGFQY